MSLFHYAANTYFVTCNEPDKMTSSKSFKDLEKLILQCVKTTFHLPKKGSGKPILDLFKDYDPRHIIMKNYLQTEDTWAR